MKQLRFKNLLSTMAVVLAVAGCATDTPTAVNAQADAAPKVDAIALMKATFKDKGQALASRIDQDELQRTCSEYAAKQLDLPKDVRERLEASEMKLIKAPSDSKYLGDWKRGEATAQNGRGFQWTDDPKAPTGANCYACHQLSKAELSYGNIGPSLLNYGKVRGQGKEMLEYTWGKIFNSHAYNACSVMPRYGTRNLITEQQVKDVMALLFDPNSPVNQ